MSEQIKGACVHCGGHIAYDEANAGRTIQCPHCTQSIKLGGAAAPVTAPIAVAAPSSTTGKWKIGIALMCGVVVIGAGIGLQLAANHKGEAQKRAAQEATRLSLQEERLKAEAEKARAEAELAKAKLQKEEQAKAAAKAFADAQTAATEQLAKEKAAQKLRLEEEIKNRVKGNPAVWPLWEEQNHEAIKITATHPKDATVQHNGTSAVVKYDDMPEWLRTAAQTKHQQDGEAKGFIREVNGKIYDLRTSPPGWVALPAAEVIQIVNDGYLLIDVASLNQIYSPTKVFKLKHNGLTRILNNGDRIQITAMTVGTYAYENRRREFARVPVYDPGMPVGPLRERVVALHGTATPPFNPSKPAAEEPSKSGSGFFISDDGLFITNAHVVEDSVKVEVKSLAGKKHATVLRIDKDKDLALLRVSVVEGTVPALRISTNNVPIGTQVFTVGYPMIDLQGSQPKFTDGKVSSVAGLHDNPEEMQISVAVQPGNSGGPLADINGDIVGVIVARLNDFTTLQTVGTIPQNVNYAVKGSTLVRFLKENRDLVPDVKFGKSTARSQEEAIHAVEKASGLVLGYD